MVTDTIATAQQGDPFEEDTILGPVATRSQFDTVTGHVDSGHAEEAVEIATSTGPGIEYLVEGLAAYLTETSMNRKTRNAS